MKEEYIKAAIVSEGYIEQVISIRADRFELYEAGMIQGASMYGMGSCGLYDEKDLKDEYPDLLEEFLEREADWIV